MGVYRRRKSFAFTGAFLLLALAAWYGEALANPKLIMTTWRIEPSTVKENQPWTVKLWVGNIGSEAPKKGFTVQVLGCDKDYGKCEKVYATQEVKPTGDLAPGKLPGREIVMEIKQGLAKGDYYILFVVDSNKEIGEPVSKRVQVPVGYHKY